MDSGHNSGTPTSPGSDLASKYTKLASEYSKVRAQLGVLKKAVLEEQVRARVNNLETYKPPKLSNP